MSAHSDETAVQIMVSLLKSHGIRKVIASPGTGNVGIVGTMQQDEFFEMYSSVDERSAAYMACGMAAESREPVVLTCTGATASRNYVPGLTEAYYRNLPVLAITASIHLSNVGQGIPQVLDRGSQLKDMVRKSVLIDEVCTEEDRWGAEVSINDAILELTKDGGGPVHINLVTRHSVAFEDGELPSYRCIRRVADSSKLPVLPSGKVAVFVGAHAPFDDELTNLVDSFCDAHDAVVFCDQTSNYRGKYRVLGNMLSWQDAYRSPVLAPDLLIHIGFVSGSYMKLTPKNVWRVDPRGDVKDTFRKLSYVFEMSEKTFFAQYAEGSSQGSGTYLREALDEDASVRLHLPDLPFSNVWCAQQSAPLVPEGSVLHFGILNSLRSWNLFETPSSVTCYSNTGGFGIDGGVSAMIGASLASPRKTFFGVVGDLAFFYDMNSIGNRSVGPNIRLMVINNGRGTEFRNYWHPATAFGDDADMFMAAAGHFGNKSHQLLRHYATDLGFEYLSATTKEDFLNAAARFFDPAPSDKPMLLEVFTETSLESKALKMVHGVRSSKSGSMKQKAKELLGPKGIKVAKRIIGR